MPKISIVIPAYNRADILPRTIKSVLAQTFSDFELIVVDDGSTDGTRQVVEEIAKNDNRVRYVWQENSGGAARPKNTAFPLCQGEFIAYLDHDDEWMPDKLQKQYDFFLNSDKKNLGLVSCNVLIVNQTSEVSGVHKMHKYSSIEDLLLEGGNYAFSNSSIMVPRKVVEVVGDRDENLKLFEDQDIFIRIAEAGYVFDFVDDVLIKYYIDDTNLSKDFKRCAPDYERFVNKHMELLKKYRKILAIHYRHLGTMNFLASSTAKAYSFFFKSITTYPSLRNIATALCSLLGKRMYLAILNFKKGKALLSY